MKTRNAICLGFGKLAAGALLLLGTAYAAAESTSKVNGVTITLPTADDFARATGIKPLDKPLNVKVCIFDPIGNSGPAIQYARDLVLQARRWNVFLDIQAFTDERVAAEDFKAGQCDAVALSTFRAKQFNKFMGSFDAVGALQDYAQVRTAMNVLYTNPKVAPYMIEGDYQVGGIVPIGAVYVMVNDRSINSIEKAAGKKVAVLDFDKSQAKMVERLGAQPVPSDISNFSGKFNNGQVDIIAAPAIVFRPLELYRGLGDKGGIYRIPLVMMSGSVVFRREKFLREVPDLDDKVQKIRNFAITYLDQAYALIDSVEKDIPERFWMDLSPEDKDKYFRMMREARLQLMQDGTYDPKMLGLLKKVRCKHNPGSYECALKDE
ncbi:MAG: putative solute-binding protein [Pseudomonadota bacterium]